MWRSGSTFAWSRFREAPQTYCYFEPLYAGLSKLTHRRIFGNNWREAISDNRHPAMTRPYYAEYAPLVRRRGVAGFRRSFSLGRYALAPEQSLPELEQYLGLLIAEASDRGRIPVLGCNRSGLRIGWIKRRFASFDIHVERDPQLIWASYMEHAERENYSYFVNLLTILELNAEHPLFSPLARRLPLRSGLARLVKPKLFYREAARQMPHEISYAIVLYFWTMKLAHALTYADVILETSLSNHPGYRRRIGDRISRGCGVAVSFEALRRVGAAADVSMRDRRAAERLVLDLLPRDQLGFSDPDTIERRLPEIAPEKAAFFGEVLVRTGRSEAA